MEKEYNRITTVVAKYYNIPLKHLFTEKRDGIKPFVRAMSAYVIYNTVRGSTTLSIGKYFGRNHATVLHMLKTVKEQLNLYRDVEGDYDKIMKILFGTFEPKDKYYEKSNLYYCLPCNSFGIMLKGL